MTTEPLISCIVPVYNGERYLGETLDSIFGQTYRPLEVIVVDDGSTDGTVAVVASYGPAVQLLSQPNSGHAAARNLGLSAARGELVAFLDADDLWHPEKLERQVARFRARPELDLCVTHVRNFWAPELAAEREQLRDQRHAQPLPGYSTVTLLARRSVFKRVGRFDPALKHGDDTEWFLRAADLGAVSELLPDVLVLRRLHPTSRSREHAAESRDEYLQIIKTALDRRRGMQMAPAASSSGQLGDAESSAQQAPGGENSRDGADGQEGSALLGAWKYRSIWQFPFGDDTTYRKAIAYLDGHGDIADWGCGTAYARRFVTRSSYVGIDGSRSKYTDIVADLREYRVPTDCILLRHVLEHNLEWDRILENALLSFQKRMVVIVFTPFVERTQPIRWWNSVPDISFRKSDLVRYLDPFLHHEESFVTNSQYRSEHIFYLEKG